MGWLCSEIKSTGKSAGLCLTLNTPLESVRKYVSQIEILMFLAIREPGRSGQMFEMETLKRIEEVSHWKERDQFDLCVDGGVSESNIHLLNVEYVVSGSSVLEDKTPIRQIMRLQTSNNYEAT